MKSLTKTLFQQVISELSLHACISELWNARLIPKEGAVEVRKPTLDKNTWRRL